MELPACKLEPAVLDHLRSIFGSDLSIATADRLSYGGDCWPLVLLERRDGRVSHPADAVAWPIRTEQIQALLRLAAKEGFAVVPWGGGSGVAGGAIPVRGGVALDLKRMRRLIGIREDACLCEVETGILGQHLEEALNRRGYTLGHFPSSIYCSTVGGWLAARSSGQASTRYGNIEDLCAGLEVVLPSGDIAMLGPHPRSAAGPDWKHVLIGSEGTLGVMTRAFLRIRELPETRRFLCFRFPGVSSGLAAIRRVLRRGYRPAVVRLYDPLDTLVGVAGGGGKSGGVMKALTKAAFEAAKGKLLAYPRFAPFVERFAGGCHAVFVCEGDARLADLEAEVVREEALRAGGVDKGEEPARHWQEHRYDISFKGASVFEGDGFVDTMELAAPWDRIEPLYHEVKAAISKHAVTLAHFSHAYLDGVSVYFSFAAAPPTEEASRETYRRIWEDGLEAALRAGGTTTHHHGVGLLKADALVRELGPAHALLRGLKQAIDPQNILNPGKLGLP